jgi:hypothetical protein
MDRGRLTPLQARILVVLAGVDPPWSLVGGGALVGFHTRHRETRDLDLFFRPQRALVALPASVTRRLEVAGLQVVTIQSAPAFCQLEVRDEQETIILDLVADPTPVAESAAPTTFGGETILVETPHQLLINKLCALLSRAELRDLVDVRALLEAGGDLDRALADCPGQDGGFSPLTLSWVLRGLPIKRLARVAGRLDADVTELVAFRDQLVDRVLAASRPG